MARMRSVRDVMDVFLAGLDEIPEEFLICRELQHVWEITDPFRVVDSTREQGRQSRGGERVFAERKMTCRRCKMIRSDAFKISSVRGRTSLRKISGTYFPPEGYAIPGIGRGVKGLTDFVHGAAFDQVMNETPIRAQGRPRKDDAV